MKRRRWSRSEGVRLPDGTTKSWAEVSREAAEDKERRKELKLHYQSEFAALLEILTRFDFEGIAIVPDEYEPEVGTILPRLSEAGSPGDVAEIIRQEFLRWFGSDRPASHYAEAAREVWAHISI
jgi:hypothetical protein